MIEQKSTTERVCPSEVYREGIEWNGITISVSFIANYPIEEFCHIELHASEPLPVTETGYRSHFMGMVHLADYDDHIAYVRAWLDDAANSKKWKLHVEQSRQGDLFDL